jgi:hypothetical protein
VCHWSTPGILFHPGIEMKLSIFLTTSGDTMIESKCNQEVIWPDEQLQGDSCS